MKSKIMKTKINKKVMTDILTGLPNRRSLLDKVNINEVNRRKQRSDTALIFVLLDSFRIVNDNYNHRDVILVEVSKRLKEQLRTTDIVARWSSNEFLILLPHTNANHAFAVAENLRREISNVAIEIDKCKYEVTATFGVSEYQDDDTFEETLINTGAAMIHHSGVEHNRVVMA